MTPRPTKPGFYRYRALDIPCWSFMNFRGDDVILPTGERCQLRDMPEGEWDGPIGASPPLPMPCGHPIACARPLSEYENGCGWCAEREELLESFMDAAAQACYSGTEGLLDSSCASSRADILRVLAKYGKIELTIDNGRNVQGKWVKE